MEPSHAEFTRYLIFKEFDYLCAIFFWNFKKCYLSKK